MHKLISGFLSLFFYFFFGLFLLVFHVVQVITFNIFGLKVQEKMVALLNFFLLKCLYIVGGSSAFKCDYELPVDVPLIVVSNHQSMFDIPLFAWYLREFNPKYISKKELGKGIPSISYNLRNGGSVLIDRKNKRQSLPAIIAFGKRIHEHNGMAVIFPEGTRSKTGKPKPFAETGLKILTRQIPNGYVVPTTINNSWKLAKYGNFPIGAFHKITLEVHEPIAINSCTFEELLEKTERQVTQAIL